MIKNMTLLCGLFMTTSLQAKDNCKNNDPVNLLEGFEGTFKGVLAALNFQGESLPQQNMIETHTITGCNSFDADIRYSDPQTGKETRQVKFSGKWDRNKQGFVLTGPLLQGLMRVIQPGQYVLNFDTKFGGNPARCNEMISITNKAQQVVRSVQCFENGSDGPSLGVRTALGTRIP